MREERSIVLFAKVVIALSSNVAITKGCFTIKNPHLKKQFLGEHGKRL